MSQTEPLLSVGVIFKNEIRCLERCFKSVAALKKVIPCELVVADTGSDDGSREVAERYADIVVDFPWINDFSAARNAVMDRCSGEWYMPMDADEWLDEDVSQLVRFLTAKSQRRDILCCVVNVRNYTRFDLKGDYSDFLALRLVKMSTGVRYIHPIHEQLDKPLGVAHILGKTILHHDGYVGFSGPEGAVKRERNMSILRKQLEKNPDDLLTRLQCVESSDGEEKEAYLRSAVDGVDQKLNSWDKVGPAIYRYAVSLGQALRMPEFEDWMKRAWELFPNSMFTKIDVGYIRFQILINEKRWEEAIPIGRGYLSALHEYRTSETRSNDLMFSSLMLISRDREESLRVQLVEAMFSAKQYKEARGMLTRVDLTTLDIPLFLRCIVVLLNLQAQSRENMGQVMQELWSRIVVLDDAQVRISTLEGAVKPIFSSDYLSVEEKNGFRHAYTAFLPLEGRCWMGDAAVLMEKKRPQVLDKVLERYSDWNELPITAVMAALQNGAAFPRPGKPLNVESMDAYAVELWKAGGDVAALAIDLAGKELSGTQPLCWARALVLTAVKNYDWSSDKDKRGMALARAFAKIEKNFLRVCYSEETLTDEGIRIAPPMHRFGLFCSRAFDALDQGDAPGCARLLRMALETYPEMKKMVEFLTEHTAELKPPVPGELLNLAERVRTLLAGYAPDDPVVVMMKQSPAYQKVAHLIEGPELGLFGGLAQ